MPSRAPSAAISIERRPEPVPFVDLGLAHRPLRQEIDAAIARVIDGSAFIGGKEVLDFEQAFADYLGVSHVVGVASGTDALRFALLAAGVGVGDEVIVPAMTFVATAEAVVQTGARVVFADIDDTSGGLDPASVRERLSRRTRAIVPVHLYGQPADVLGLSALAEEKHLMLIEDACQAHGARHRGQRCGSLGMAAAFSFYPGKNLGGMGEGGAVSTNSAEVAARVRLLRDHGSSRRYHHEIVGYNGRLDGMQAAVLRVKLARLDQGNARRNEVASLYRKLLHGAPLTLPRDLAQRNGVYHLFVVQTQEPEHRDNLRVLLEQAGIATGLHYPTPLHLQPAFAHLGYRKGEFPRAEAIAERGLSLPMFPELTSEQVARVADSVLLAMDEIGRGSGIERRSESA